MPIDYKKYPDNWKEIRERVLKRAKNKCECCGLDNHSIVFSYIENNVRQWKFVMLKFDFDFFKPKKVKVVLTIAHLDHDEENHNVTDDRLKAMCQRLQLCEVATSKPKIHKHKIHLKL